MSPRTAISTLAAILTAALVAAAGTALLIRVGELRRSSGGAPVEEVTPQLIEECRGRNERVRAEFAPRTIERARRLASFGSRQTGSEGCRAAYEYLAGELAAACGGPLREYEFDVAVPVSSQGTLTLGDGRTFAVHPLRPNCVHPCNTPPGGLRGRLAYAGRGTPDELAAANLSGAIALMEFNSGERWTRAAEYGAKAVVFIEPDFTTTRQADEKYLETVPLGFTRVWMDRESGAALAALASSGAGVEATLEARTEWRTVKAPCVEATVRGARPETLVWCAQFDSSSVVPALAPGGDEVFGAAALVELARYFSEFTPEMTLRFILFSGSEQDLAAPREYVAEHLSEIGPVVRAALSLDLSAESDGVAVTFEGYHGMPTWWYVDKNAWLRERLFPPRGTWFDLLEESLGKGEHPLFGNARPIAYGSDTSIATSAQATPMTLAPKLYTASEPWGTVGAPSYCITTEPKRRFVRWTPLDTFERASAGRGGENVARAFETVAFLAARIARLDGDVFTSRGRPFVARDSRGSGGYVELSGRLAEYRTEKVWYEQGVPRRPDGSPVGDAFVLAWPTYKRTEYPYFLHLPMAPWRQCHQNLQSHMVKYLVKLPPDGRWRIPCAHLMDGDTCYNFMGYVLDESGNVAYASDLGLQGDVSFRQANVQISTARPFIPVTVFPCGTLALFDLLDAARYKFNEPVLNEGYIQWGWPGASRLTQDYGEHPFLPIAEIRDARSQTEPGSFGFVQYRSTGMMFLPDSTPCMGLLGTERRKFLVLGNFDEGGGERPRGYTLARGEQRMLAPGAATGFEEMRRLDSARLKAFGALGVRSRLAEDCHAEAASLAEAAGASAIRSPGARAVLSRAWDAESAAYRAVQALKYDVVKTTVFYFILLIPFAFLVERLVAPQVTFLRTVFVSAAVFLVFAVTLYWFHPGFRLAENIFVTIVSFIIVLLTIPALAMLVARGGAMLKKLAGSYAVAHHARVERQGMILSALSLSVSNMRRRRLRTALTLGTIALLVMSLVLFTSATSFQRDFERPSSMGSPPYAGIQVFNTYYHIHALAAEQVELLEEALAGTSTVVRREYLNYGMKLVEPAKLYLRRASGPAVPPGAVADADRLIDISRAAAGSGTREALVQVTEHGLIVPSVQFVEPDEVKVTRVDSAAIVRGRFFRESDVFACVISTEAARCLGLDVGERASFEGFELEVVGLFDPARMDAIRDLDGSAWTPIQFSATQEEYDRPNHEPSAPVLYLPRRLNEETAYFPTAIWSVVIVPHDLARTGELARRLAREIRNVDVYESTGDRVSIHSAHATITVSGAAFLIGPLVITFFMILNIMLGTVYERTREINVFSSVGLSPAHVALMFLTESVVYAAVASVLGYFAGVTLLTLFMRLGWLPAAFYPNYLGVVVIYATALAAAATVTSSIYPMMIASRIVNPSLARTWRIDAEPEGVRWRIHFPFITHSRDEALGIMAFLAEFVEHNSGEAKGCFTAEGGAVFRDRAPTAARPGEAAPEERMELAFPAWLAPFERNVTQKVIYAAELDRAKRRWHFAFELERTSGEDYLWRKSNRYFLDLFRKQLLLWRSLDDRVVADYAGRGRALASPAESVGAEVSRGG